MVVVLILAVLFAMLALGAPVGFAMAVSGTVGLYEVGGLPMLNGVLTSTPITAMSSYELITIPMFLLLAEMVLASGIADDLFTAAAAWVGRIPGGLGMATALAGAGFGTICGSSTAAAATLSSTSLPAMIRQGYEPRMAAGVVAISGTLSMLLPTSIALLIYGLLAEVSIGKLLMSGILPAVLITLVIMATVLVLVWQDPTRAPFPARVPLRDRIRLLTKVAPMLVLFLGISAVIYTGIGTPTEASAAGAFGAFLFAAARGTPVRILARSVQRAALSTCMIAVILLGAAIFSDAFALTQSAQHLVAWVGTLPVSPWIVISLILCAYIVLGSFMDQMAILVLTVPIVLPVIRSLGFDPIWFGVVKIVTAEVGLITPPIGLNCFIVARYSGRPVGEIFRGIVPHFVAHLIAIALLVAFPQIVLWLPSRM